MEDESRFEVGIDGWLVMKLCCLNKLDCGQTDTQAGRQTDQQAIVRKRADGPDYIPRLFPLVVPAATSLICHSSPSVCM